MRRVNFRLVSGTYSNTIASPTRTLFRLWVAFDKVWETLDQQFNRQTSEENENG